MEVTDRFPFLAAGPTVPFAHGVFTPWWPTYMLVVTALRLRIVIFNYRKTQSSSTSSFWRLFHYTTTATPTRSSVPPNISLFSSAPPYCARFSEFQRKLLTESASRYNSWMFSASRNTPFIHLVSGRIDQFLESRQSRVLLYILPRTLAKISSIGLLPQLSLWHLPTCTTTYSNLRHFMR